MGAGGREDLERAGVDTRKTLSWTYWQMLTMVSGVILLLTMFWDPSKASAWRWIIALALVVGSSIWMVFSHNSRNGSE